MPASCDSTGGAFFNMKRGWSSASESHPWSQMSALTVRQSLFMVDNSGIVVARGCTLSPLPPRLCPRLAALCTQLTSAVPGGGRGGGHTRSSPTTLR